MSEDEPPDEIPELNDGGSSATLGTGRYDVPDGPIDLPESPAAGTPFAERYDERTRVSAPGGDPTVVVGVADGRPHYEVRVEDTPVLTPAQLGIRFADGPDLVEGFRLDTSTTTEQDRSFDLEWGATRSVHYHHRELRARFVAGSRELLLIVRAAPDGVAFRYRVPDQPGLDSIALRAETTEVRFARQGTAWWIPGDFDSYEYRYRETPLGEVKRAHTPFTVRLDSAPAGADGQSQSGDGSGFPARYVSVHEADLTGYAAATLQPGTAARSFRTLLTPTPGSPPVTGETPFVTPWRTVTLARRPGELVESDQVLALNDPPSGDFSWVDPGTYLGIWWAMHIGEWTWAPGPRLGATTEHALEYIDFAAEHDVSYLLVEGWNVGWDNEDWQAMDHTTPNDEYDLERVVEYGAERGVELVGHVETGGDVRNFEDQLADTLDLFAESGIPAVKTGYVGTIDGHSHHGQRMVEHHRRVLEMAAERGLLVDIHEGIKPTGLRRTFPNLMTAECVRGQEFEAWSAGNSAHHLLTIPFTRMLGGPVDYTPGIFDIDLPAAAERPTGETTVDREYRVHTTRAFQLALYVLYLSGLGMLADLPRNYEGTPEFRFLERVPTSWDESRVLDAAIGDHALFARRHGDVWYVAGGTVDPRTFEVRLDFLEDGPHTANVYADGPDADYDSNPTDVSVETLTVEPGDTLAVSAVHAGGFAARFEPADDSSGNSSPD